MSLNTLRAATAQVAGPTQPGLASAKRRAVLLRLGLAYTLLVAAVAWGVTLLPDPVGRGAATGVACMLGIGWHLRNSCKCRFALEAHRQAFSEMEERVRDRTLQIEAAFARLRESEQRYLLVVEGTECAVWDWEPARRKLFLSSRWQQMLEYAAGELAADLAVWLRRVHPADRERVLGYLNPADSSPPGYPVEFRMRHRDGTFRWLSGVAAVGRAPDGSTVRVAGTLRDVTGSKTIDAETGLATAAVFNDELERVREQHRLRQGHGYSVLIFKLMRLTQLEAAYGRTVVDKLLADVGQRVRRAVLASPVPGQDVAPPLAASLGWGRLAILTAQPGEPCQALAFAQSVLAALSPPAQLGGRDVPLAWTAGLASVRPSDHGDPDCLADAEIARSAVASAGRGTLAVFEEGMRRQREQELDLECDLRSAVARGQMFLAYQPQVELASGRLLGLEALLRWRHPQRGLIPPLDFLPLAERNGSILPIGTWVLEEACRQAAEWRRVPALSTCTMSVNVSPLQLLDPSFAQSVANVLARHQFPPGQLHLELTESALVQHGESIQGLLEVLNTMGVGLELDDFGTGYSALEYLCRLPVQTLKLDRSFVRRLGSESDRTVVAAMVSLADRLGLRVIVEGVESEAERRILLDLGCREAQGYLFGRPMDASSVPGWACTAAALAQAS